jgi:hypothetical protein
VVTKVDVLRSVTYCLSPRPEARACCLTSPATCRADRALPKETSSPSWSASSRRARGTRRCTNPSFSAYNGSLGQTIMSRYTTYVDKGVDSAWSRCKDIIVQEGVTLVPHAQRLDSPRRVAKEHARAGDHPNAKPSRPSASARRMTRALLPHGHDPRDQGLDPGHPHVPSSLGLQAIRMWRCWNA